MTIMVRRLRRKSKSSCMKGLKGLKGLNTFPISFFIFDFLCNNYIENPSNPSTLHTKALKSGFIMRLCDKHATFPRLRRGKPRFYLHAEIPRAAGDLIEFKAAFDRRNSDKYFPAFGGENLDLSIIADYQPKKFQKPLAIVGEIC